MPVKHKMLFSEFVKKDIERWKFLYHNIDEYAEKRVGVSRTVIFDMLKGKYDAPSVVTATRMCDWFDLEPEDLCDMITNADDFFVDGLLDKYNGGRFEKNCKKAIQDFCRHYENSDLEESESLECKFGVNDFTINLDGFDNTSESSICDGHSYNATCTYTKYDVNRILDGDDDGVYSSDYISCHEIESKELALYYLPSRRIRKKTSKSYPDEQFRDFTNKVMYLLTADDPPKNNLFLTTSENLFMEICSYMQGLAISSAKDIGIAIACHSYRKMDMYTAILKNNDLISDYLLDTTSI